jgi:hypothetical protein
MSAELARLAERFSQREGAGGTDATEAKSPDDQP